jgi:DNA-binding NarL/FixJ family response regulator
MDGFDLDPGHGVRSVHGRACAVKVLGVGADENGGSGQPGLQMNSRLRSDAPQVNVVVLAADKPQVVRVEPVVALLKKYRSSANRSHLIDAVLDGRRGVV